jgi:hypothetical protein
MVQLEIAAPPAASSLLELMQQFYAEVRYPFDREKARSALEPFLANPALGRAWVFRDGDTVVGYFVLTLGWRSSTAEGTRSWTSSSSRPLIAAEVSDDERSR